MIETNLLEQPLLQLSFQVIPWCGVYDVSVQAPHLLPLIGRYVSLNLRLRRMPNDRIAKTIRSLSSVSSFLERES